MTETELKAMVARAKTWMILLNLRMHRTGINIVLKTGQSKIFYDVRVVSAKKGSFLARRRIFSIVTLAISVRDS